MTDTEREAIEAGDIWWDAELFTTALVRQDGAW